MPNSRIISIDEITEMKRLLDEELKHRGGTNSIWGLQGWQDGSSAPQGNNFISPAQANWLGKTFKIIQNIDFSVTSNDATYQFPEQEYHRMEDWVYANAEWDHVMPEVGTKERERYIDNAASGCRVQCQGLCSSACYSGCKDGCGSTCSGGCGNSANNDTLKTIIDYETAPAEILGPWGNGCNSSCGKSCGGLCANTCTGQCSNGCSGSCAVGDMGY